MLDGRVDIVVEFPGALDEVGDARAAAQPDAAISVLLERPDVTVCQTLFLSVDADACQADGVCQIDESPVGGQPEASAVGIPDHLVDGA